MLTKRLRPTPRTQRCFPSPTPYHHVTEGLLPTFLLPSTSCPTFNKKACQKGENHNLKRWVSIRPRFSHSFPRAWLQPWHLREELSPYSLLTFNPLLLCISLCNLFFLQMIVSTFLWVCACMCVPSHKHYPENSEAYFYPITHTFYKKAPIQTKAHKCCRTTDCCNIILIIRIKT